MPVEPGVSYAEQGHYFAPHATIIFRTIILGGLLFVMLVGLTAWRLQASSYVTGQNVVIDQPVPFSHKHHAGELGIDCRYCHGSMRESSTAPLPTTKTCMTCHSRIWTNAAILQPVRDSWRGNTPIRWNKVHQLPDYVYFDHSIHLSKGVGCVTCHGRVDEMALVRQSVSMTMSWCLECHRAPERYLRPRSEVFNMSFSAERAQQSLGHELVIEYEVRSPRALTDCSTCHR